VPGERFAGGHQRGQRGLRADRLGLGDQRGRQGRGDGDGAFDLGQPVEFLGDPLGVRVLGEVQGHELRQERDVTVLPLGQLLGGDRVGPRDEDGRLGLPQPVPAQDLVHLVEFAAVGRGDRRRGGRVGRQGRGDVGTELDLHDPGLEGRGSPTAPGGAEPGELGRVRALPDAWHGHRTRGDRAARGVGTGHLTGAARVHGRHRHVPGRRGPGRGTGGRRPRHPAEVVVAVGAGLGRNRHGGTPRGAGGGTVCPRS
jgi:hypothetical protein